MGFLMMMMMMMMMILRVFFFSLDLRGVLSSRKTLEEMSPDPPTLPERRANKKALVRDKLVVENLLSNSYIYGAVYIYNYIYIARNQDFHLGIISNIFLTWKKPNLF